MGRRGACRCARAPTRSTSRRSRASRAAAATARPPASRANTRSTRSRSSSAASTSRRLVPRALEPAGVVLLDKPAGPSSFKVIAELRRRTGARTGHAGTLDPFATGLLLVLSGWATKLQPCFVGLDKRYLTDVDLSATTSTGDPEGEVVERHEPPEPDELQDRVALLRGEVALPIPAASAVKIGGERAYRLARRGVEVVMPHRRSQISAHDVVAYREGVATLDLHVSSGTYVRAIATALGGHCRTLRRLEIGPFSVDDADPDRMLPPAEAFDRLPPGARGRAPQDALVRMARR